MAEIIKINSFPGQNSHYYLNVFEQIPFEVKRFYYLNKIDQETQTGAHAHIREEEFFVILKGNATLILDEGNGLKEYNLTENDAIYVKNLVWHQFKNIEKDSIILALSSTHYKADRSDYIENYKQFLLKIADKN